MKRTLLAALVVLLSSVCALAQGKLELKGVVIESETNEPLMGATVQLLAPADSSMVSGVATDLNGAFAFTGVKRENYILRISYVGFVDKTLDLDLPKRRGTKHDLGYFTMQPNAALLKQAEVTANVAKVKVDGDSLVFNASAYRMAEGSVLEDLIKRLPGATISKDGVVKINGKEVKKVLVDGKEFFVNDQSIAMKNLPTSIIDQIKSYERKSDLARVTGIDDGEQEMVLDLSVKRGMDNGYFGQIRGALGTEKRYNFNTNINHFRGANQYSLVANAENIADYGMGGGGGMWPGWGQRDGLYAKKEVGVNFSTTSDKLETGGSLSHRYDGTDVWNRNVTQNFVTPTGAFSNSTSQSYSSTGSFSGNFRLEWNPDSLTNLIFRPSASYSRSRSASGSEAATYDVDPDQFDESLLADAEARFRGIGHTTDEDIAELVDAIVNTNTSRQQSLTKNRSARGELQLNRRLSRYGRNVTLRMTGSLNRSDSEQLSAAAIHYRPSTGRTADENNRYYSTPGRSHNYSAQLTYSEPIARQTYLQFSYRYTHSYNKTERQAYTYDAAAYTDLYNALGRRRYDIAGALASLSNYTQTADERLSQLSEYRTDEHDISVMFRRIREAYDLNLGMEVLPQHSSLNYHYMGEHYPEVTRNVFNYAPTVHVRGKFSPTSHLDFRYFGRTSQPSMTQLIDIVDDSNPLYITRGNTGLRPSFSHQFNLFFNNYKVETQTGFFLWTGASFTRNSISSRTSYDQATGVRTTRPENINGNWDAYAGFGFNTALDKKKALTLDSHTDFNYSNSVSYLDPEQYTQEKSTTKDLSVEQYLSLNYRDEIFSVGVNGNLTYNHSDNNVITDSRLNTYSFSYGVDCSINAPWGTALNTDISMNSRRGFAMSSMNTNELLWNVQVSHSFLKGRALTLAFSWNDILRQQSNVSRTVDAMMRSDSRYNSIYSYGMFKVVYKLNIFGGKNVNGTDRARGEERGWGGW